MLTSDQKAERLKGIGASECSIVMGLNTYMSPYELWLEKTGKSKYEELSTNNLLVFGNILESPVLNMYEHLTGKSVLRNSKQLPLYHPEHNHIYCTPDATVDEEKRIIEVKTASPYSKEWGDHGTDQIPIKYMCQVQHQLLVTGWDDADLIVFRATTDVRIYHIRRDDIIINEIIKRVNNFWYNHVMADIPPELIILKDVEYFFPKNNANYIEADDELLNELNNVVKLRAHIKRLEDQKSKLEVEILKKVGGSEGIKSCDETLLTWKANKNGKRVLRINMRGSL